MEEKDYNPNLVTYNLLIGGLCNHEHVDEAIGYRKLMMEKGVVSDWYSYSMIIDELCKAKRSSDAILIQDDLKNAGLKPKTGPYSSLINRLMQKSKKLEALSSSDDMVDKLGTSQNLKSYLTLSKKFVDTTHTSDLKFARNILAMMAETRKPMSDVIDAMTSVELTSDMFTLVVYAYMNRHLFDEDVYLLLNYKNEEAWDDGVLPDVNSYYPIIHGLCKAKRIEEAWDLFAKMVENGVKPDVITYGALMSAYNNLAKDKDVIMYFKELIAHGISPDQDVLAFMFEGRFKKGFLYSKKPFSIMRKMVGNNVLPNNMHIYNAFIKGFSENDVMDLAMKLLAEVHERGLNPDAFTYRSLISGYLDEDDTEKAQQLFNEMQQRNVCPNDVTYKEFFKTLPEKRKKSCEALCLLVKKKRGVTPV